MLIPGGAVARSGIIRHVALRGTMAPVADDARPDSQYTGLDCDFAYLSCRGRRSTLEPDQVLGTPRGPGGVFRHRLSPTVTSSHHLLTKPSVRRPTEAQPGCLPSQQSTPVRHAASRLLHPAQPAHHLA